MTTLETGEYVIRNESEVLTVGFTPDVLLRRDGEYTKLKDTDVTLGKLKFGNVYYHKTIKDNVTLLENIPHEDCDGDIVIKTTFGNNRETNSSLKYLSDAKEESKFKVGDKVKMIDDSQCNDKGTGEIVRLVRKNNYEVKLLTLDTGEEVPKYTLLYGESQLEPLTEQPETMTLGDWEFRKMPCGEAIEVYNSYTGLVAAKFVDMSNGWFSIGNTLDRLVYNDEQEKYQKRTLL